MGASDYFLSMRPAYPWSEYPLGLPALGLTALAIVLLTLWTYRHNVTATRRRLAVILGLRLLALAVAIVTALRPSVGVQEDPRLPSTLLIGIDLSESMTIRDETDNQARIAAVRKTLSKCEATIESIKSEQGVTVVFYQFGNSDFAEVSGLYSPEAPAAFRRSDYGVYLRRTFEKWQTERFIRGHLVIGDGADNGTTVNAEAEASRWRMTAPIHTFSVGRNTTRPDGKDVAIAGVSAEPQPVPIKTDVTLKVNVNAFGFAGRKVPVVVYFDGEQKMKIEAVLEKEIGNEISIVLKAPEKPGEVKVRVEIPHESVPGDANAANNTLETYLTVTKEGVRVLLVDRDRFEHTFLRDVLASEKRFDVTDVVRQRDDPPSPREKEAFDFASKRYDVIVIGNVSAKQLQAIDPKLPEMIREQVEKQGTGLIMLGGDASFAGTNERPLDTGWKGTALEPLLPVKLDAPLGVPDAPFRGENGQFQAVPTERGLQYLMKVMPTNDLSFQQWSKLNEIVPGRTPNRMTAISRLGEPKPGAAVFAVASNSRTVEAKPLLPNQVKAPYLLVGWEVEGGGKGRVLAFAGYDTYMWRPFGRRMQPPTREGFELHAQFWKRLMLWLAHQDDAEGAAYAKPEYRRLPVRGKQTIAVGLKSPDGAEILNPTLEVKLVLPGQTPEQASKLQALPGPDGKLKVAYEPTVPGEYSVMVKASGKDATGKDVQGDATARFVVFPESSDELLRAAADLEFLERLSRAGGGQPHALADLPQYLNEIKAAPLLNRAKEARFYPEWNRKPNNLFLPGWVVAFALILGLEWGLRRFWGLA